LGGTHPSTVCRELERSASSEADRAEHAQRTYRERRKASVPIGNWSGAMAASLEDKLKVTWSPEQITERFRVDGLPVVSFKTIYRWIYDERLVRGTLQVLRHKGKRQKLAVNSSLVNPFRIVRKWSVLVKRLALGTGYRRFGSWKK